MPNRSTVRAETLSASAAGMTRLRDKGGASPQSLYELTNGYVNASRAPTQRPGTTWLYQFGANTKGLVAFQGVFYAFTNNPASVVSTGTYQVVLLRHPSASFAGSLSEIHYTVPFMGYLYVVAGFSDGSVYHYWLQNPTAWQANTVYATNVLVQPTTVNGYYYKAVQIAIYPAWAAHTNYTVGSIVSPTVYSGFEYKVIAAIGGFPLGVAATSGPNEPAWSTTVGGITMDFSGGNPSTNPGQVTPPPTAPPAQPPGTEPGGRYWNGAGSQTGPKVENP